MCTDDSNRNPVEELAEEFLRRRRDGEKPSIADYVKNYPQWEEDIRDVFSAVMMIEHVNPNGHANEPSPLLASVAFDGTKIEQLGDYRILREIGRGGMGVVYEAEQVSLGRHVALKVLPPHALLDKKYLQRFEREARAAGRLHHSNIVPVFGVGHHDGLHYYVMQFIAGAGLDDVLSDVRTLRKREARTKRDSPDYRRSDESSQNLATSLICGDFRTGSNADLRVPFQAQFQDGSTANEASDPLFAGSSGSADLTRKDSGVSSSHAGRPYWQSIVRIAAQVADALDYAHAHGTLHRDVKPSNLLLDATGTVWVTDFGLAKLEEEVDLTRTGDIVGTLRYIAPETLHGESDNRSDVYSLGLTLYELATLRPAHDDSNRHRLLENISQRQVTPPRKINPQIPRDLETIILKATALEPARRYESARDFKRDLDRFLEDKPIEARRASSPERLWRWTRRNPIVAGLTSAVAILLVAVTAISYLSRQRALYDLAYKTSETKRATENETRAVQRLYDARVAQAQATLASRQIGQRTVTMEAVTDAAKLIDRLNYGDDQCRQLRNLTIKALTVIDIQPQRKWSHSWTPGIILSSNRDANLYAQTDRIQQNIIVRRMENNNIVANLRLKKNWHTVAAIEFSYNDEFVAAMIRYNGRSQTSYLTIWRIEDNGLPILSMPLYMRRERTNPFCLHPSENVIAIGMPRGEIRQIELVDMIETVVHEGTAYASTLQYSPDGERLALCRDNSIDVLETNSGQVIWSMPGVSDVYSLNWGPDSVRLTAACPKQVYVLDTSKDANNSMDGAATMRLTGDGAYSARFDASGRLLMTNGSSISRLWDASNGRELLQMSGTYLGFCHSGDRLSLGSGYSSVLTDSDEYFVLLPPPIEPFARPQQMDVHPNGRLLAAGRTIWDLARRTAVFVDEKDGGLMRFHGEHLLLRFAKGNTRRHVARLEERHEEILFQIDSAKSIPSSATGLSALSDTGTVVTAGHYVRPYEVTLTDLNTDRTVTLHPRHVAAKFVDITRDGKFVATGTWHRSNIKIWNAATGEVIKTISAASARPRFSADGKLLAVCNGRRVDVYQMHTWKLLFQTEDNPGSHPRDAAFSPDGCILAINKPDNIVQFLSTDSFDEIARFPVPDDETIESMIFDRSGSQLIIGVESGAIHVWNLYALRKRLASMGIDWNTLSVPKPTEKKSKPIRIEIENQSSFSDSRLYRSVRGFLESRASFLKSSVYAVPPLADKK